MADKNVVSQEVKLNTKGYTDGLKQMKAEGKSSTSSLNQDLTSNASQWDTLTNNVKLSVGSISKELKSLGKETLKNVLTGATAGLGAKAAAGANAAINQSVQAMLSFGEAMSRVQLKTGASKKQIDALQDSMAELARSGTSLSSIPDAFDEIFSATGNVEKTLPVLSQVTKFASGTTSKNATPVSEFVRKTLTSENQEVNTDNTKALLDSVAKMMKTGSFKTLDEAMASFGGVDTGAMKNIKMDNKSAAGLLAGASGVANKEQSLAAVNELIKGAGTGFAGNAVLSGILGGNILKGGKLNTSELSKASARYKKSGLSEQGFKQLLGGSGLSEDAVNGLTNILANSDKFAEGIKKFNESTLTADEAVDQLNDNFAAKLQKALQSVSASFFELLHHLTSLDFGGVASDFAKHWQSILGGAGVATGGAAAGGLALRSVGAALGLGGSGAGAAAGAAEAVGAGGAATAGSVGLGALALPLAAGAAAIGGGAYLGSKASEMVKGTDFEQKYLNPFFDGLIKKLGLLPDNPVQRVEVHSTDPGFMAKPKSQDTQRNPKGF